MNTLTFRKQEMEIAMENITNDSSSIIRNGSVELIFGACPHDAVQLSQIMAWLGKTGCLVDVRSAREKLVSTKTPFQYVPEFLHIATSFFEIMDRSVPQHEALFEEFVRGLRVFSRLYIHCRDGHGRSALVAACVLSGTDVSIENVLQSVYDAHQQRVTMKPRYRVMGVPQNDKQRAFCRRYSPALLQMELSDSTSIEFYEPDGEYGFFSNLWKAGRWEGTRWKKGSWTKKRQQTELGEGDYTLWIEDEEWLSVEHYFQSKKFLLPPDEKLLPNETVDELLQKRQSGQEFVQLLKQADTGAKVFQLGNCGHVNRRKWIKGGYKIYKLSKENPLLINDINRTFHTRIRVRQDWTTYRDIVMMKALLAKFGQGTPLGKRLLQTGSRTIHENTTTPGDTYWGFAKGTGQDKLGKMLRIVRHMLQNSHSF